MSISEITKQFVAEEISRLVQRKTQNLKDIEELKATIAKLEAVNADIDEKMDALRIDVPAPVIIDVTEEL